MNYFTVLTVILVAQALLMSMTLALVAINRAKRQAQSVAAQSADASLIAPLKRLLMDGASPSDVVGILRAMPAHAAAAQTMHIAAARIRTRERGELAAALRDEPWVIRILEQSTSRLWWRRLEAARILAFVGEAPRDRGVVSQLLGDKHPAVQAAASTCVPQVGDAQLVREVIDGLSHRSPMVQQYELNMLREMWAFTVPLMLERLDGSLPSDVLLIALRLAETIDVPECVGHIVALRAHPNADVRLADTKALRKYFSPLSVRALLSLLDDTDWRVRSQAARGLGELSVEGAIPELTRALSDTAWWVRFRAALALAALGENGRRALRDARAGASEVARDMAAFVSGLSEGSILELSE